MDTVMKKLMTGVRIESLEGMPFFSWLNRLSKTYGTSFMVVIVLGYCTQGFRCFPWLAMSYFFKDDLQARVEPSPALCHVLVLCCIICLASNIANNCMLKWNLLSLLLLFVVAGGSWHYATTDVNCQSSHGSQAYIWHHLRFRLYQRSPPNSISCLCWYDHTIKDFSSLVTWRIVNCSFCLESCEEYCAFEHYSQILSLPSFFSY
jgi:hypothetical protein